MGEPGLFDGMAVDFGRPRASLSEARKLYAMVEALEECVDETWPDRLADVERAARRLKAHSVARAMLWLADLDALSHYGYDHMHIRANAVARRWLRRVEAAASPTDRGNAG
jgi:hypothetical protein